MGGADFRQQRSAGDADAPHPFNASRPAWARMTLLQRPRCYFEGTPPAKTALPGEACRAQLVRVRRLFTRNFTAALGKTPRLSPQELIVPVRSETAIPPRISCHILRRLGKGRHAAMAAAQPGPAL